MSIRKISFVEQEYYHIYNRGNSKQIIFRQKSDYERFVALLYLSNTINDYKLRDHNFKDPFSLESEKQLVSIGAWCLMPNHFHLLLTPVVEGGLSKFLQKLTTAYSMYFNNKYTRTGGLFEGKFRSEHAGEDRYLKYLFSYVHLNPIKLIDSKWKIDGIKNKKQAIEFLNSYKYSSYLDYTSDDRPEKAIINKEAFPDYFPAKREFNKEIFEWLFYNDGDV